MSPSKHAFARTVPVHRQVLGDTHVPARTSATLQEFKLPALIRKMRVPIWAGLAAVKSWQGMLYGCLTKDVVWLRHSTRSGQLPCLAQASFVREPLQTCERSVCNALRLVPLVLVNVASCFKVSIFVRRAC